MTSIFITGTDTDSGKTFATAGITAELRRRGIDAIPAKPVQTGCVNGFSPDLEFALGISGVEPSSGERRRMCPLLFQPACSPHLAADTAGIRIDIGFLAGEMNALLAERDLVAAEGAGGVLVPLGSGKTTLDLMVKLDWPVVLVSRDRLGTINHTLLSLMALKASGLRVCGVVVNHMEPPSELISASNIDAIRSYGGTKILGEIPYSPHRFPLEAFREICDNLNGTVL